MALTTTLIDATDKDFASIRERLYSLLRSVFPEWTDRNVANFGNLLVEMFSHVGDLLLFYQDNQAAEIFFKTAVLRRSLLALGKMLGFAPATATAATADVTLSISVPTAGDVIVPAGDFASTSEVVEPVRFQFLDTVTLPAGSTSVAAVVEHSESAEDTYTSSNLPNQSTQLSRTPYLDNSVVLTDAIGAFTQVDNFLSSAPADRHFIVQVDQNDRATVGFGNGINGAIPVGAVAILYKVGGGALGNVPLGAINKLLAQYTDTLGNPVSLQVTNPARASGGAPRMSNEEIKERAPEQVRVNGRSIALEDYEINARRLAQVARVLFLTSDQDDSVPENTGILFLIPQGGGTASSELKALVLHQVTEVYPCPTTFTVLVQDVPYKTINVTVLLYRRQGYTQASVKTAVTAAVTAFFALKNEDGTTNTRVDFGAKLLNVDGAVSPSVAWSDVFNEIRDAEGVRKLDANAGLLLNGLREDVTLTPREFPVLGNLIVIDADTGNTI